MDLARFSPFAPNFAQTFVAGKTYDRFGHLWQVYFDLRGQVGGILRIIYRVFIVSTLE